MYFTKKDKSSVDNNITAPVSTEKRSDHGKLSDLELTIHLKPIAVVKL